MKPELLKLWAKREDGDGETGPRFHPLLYHMVDVAFVTQELDLRQCLGFAAGNCGSWARTHRLADSGWTAES